MIPERVPTWIIILLAVSLFFIALFLFAIPARADKVCQSVYNPMEGRWEYQCVERERSDRRAPQCRQEYDPMNGVWVTACD